MKLPLSTSYWMCYLCCANPNNLRYLRAKSFLRQPHAAQIFSMLNRIALNLLKNEQSKKRSIKGKRLTAGWNNDYLGTKNKYFVAV